MGELNTAQNYALYQIADLAKPWLWYNQTREKYPTRKFHYHLGPTNSGKTRHALEILKRAKTGCYLSPLRLLAI